MKNIEDKLKIEQNFGAEYMIRGTSGVTVTYDGKKRITVNKSGTAITNKRYRKKHVFKDLGNSCSLLVLDDDNFSITPRRDDASIINIRGKYKWGIERKNENINEGF